MMLEQLIYPLFYFDQEPSAFALFIAENSILLAAITFLLIVVGILVSAYKDIKKHGKGSAWLWKPGEGPLW